MKVMREDVYQYINVSFILFGCNMRWSKIRKTGIIILLFILLEICPKYNNEEIFTLSLITPSKY